MSLKGLTAYTVYKLVEVTDLNDFFFEVQREDARRDFRASESEDGSIEPRQLERCFEANVDSFSENLLRPGYLYELAEYFDRVDDIEDYKLEQILDFESVRDYLSE